MLDVGEYNSCLCGFLNLIIYLVLFAVDLFCCTWASSVVNGGYSSCSTWASLVMASFVAEHGL